MNNKTVLTILLSLMGWAALGQISLDSSEFPVVGSSFTLSNVAYINIPPSSTAGPNQTYTFTGGFNYGGQLVQYNDATGGPFSASYPSATLSRYIPGDDFDQYFYYATDVNGFWKQGEVWVGYIIDTLTIDTLLINFNAPNEDTLLSNLYSYGYSDSTYALSEMTIWFGPTPVDFYNHLYKKIDADGWGTMETGFGSYDSILRVHVTEYKYDSIFVLGNFDSATLDTIEYYLYYKEGLRHPLVLEITEPFIEINGLDTTFYYVAEVLNIPPDPPIVPGCTDSTAVNFNPLANQDDGSCVICAPISYTVTPDTYICEGSNISLNVTGGSSYSWSTGESSPTITVSPTVTTTYSVFINSSQYCWEQAAIQITVYNDVVADFWNATPNIGDTTTFVNLSFGATDFFWDFGDGNTSTLQNPSNYYGSLGTYTVMLIASNTCFMDTLITTIDVVAGVPDLSNEIADFKVVPNPGSNYAKVIFSIDNSQELSLSILDVLGREITVFRDRNLAGGYHEYDISDYVNEQQAGIYFIRLASEKSRAYFKWIKQ